MTIIQSAIIHKGKMYVGRRHHEIIHNIFIATGDRPITGEQGFVTSEGKFVSRVEAAQIALKANQIAELKYHSTELFSEDLY